MNIEILIQTKYRIDAYCGQIYVNPLNLSLLSKLSLPGIKNTGEQREEGSKELRVYWYLMW